MAHHAGAFGPQCKVDPKRHTSVCWLRRRVVVCTERSLRLRTGLVTNAKSCTRRVLCVAAASKEESQQEMQFDTLYTVPRKTNAVPTSLTGGEREPLYTELIAAPRRKDKDYTIEYTPNGYLLEEVAVSTPGQRLPGEPKWYRFRLQVGEVGKRLRQTFVLKSALPPGNTSIMLDTTLSRPLGIVFAPDTKGMVRVQELISGYPAEQRSAVAKLNQTQSKEVMEGDILRAFTATVLDFPLKASLVGDLTGTIRKVVLYGVDEQRWEKTAQALRTGRKADGDVTLILERPAEGSRYATWKPVQEKVQSNQTVDVARPNPTRKESLDPMSSSGMNDNDVQGPGFALLVVVSTLLVLIVAGLF